MSDHFELVLAFFVCLLLTFAYAAYTLFAAPSAGEPFGHFLGIVGMSLMVVTETLYSLRKRVRALHGLGSLRSWLTFHIFTGIVGPFLILLHTAFAFGGLAGFATLMTGIIVLSGFVGRYIYTSVPRTRAGVEVSRDELAAQANESQRALDAWLAQKPALANSLTARGVSTVVVATGSWHMLTRAWEDFTYQQRVHRALNDLSRAEKTKTRELENLLRQHRQLENQLAWLEFAHRLMSWWRLIHVPIGALLFTAALIHILAALYYKGFHL